MFDNKEFLNGSIKGHDNLATQTARVLAQAVEYELATLEYLEGLSRPPKHELKRHREICQELVAQCWDLKIPPVGLFPHSACSRLEDKYKEFEKSGVSPIATMRRI